MMLMTMMMMNYALVKKYVMQRRVFLANKRKTRRCIIHKAMANY